MEDFVEYDKSNVLHSANILSKEVKAAIEEVDYHCLRIDCKVADKNDKLYK